MLSVPFGSEWGFSARSLHCHRLLLLSKASLNRVVPPPSREGNAACSREAWERSFRNNTPESEVLLSCCLLKKIPSPLTELLGHVLTSPALVWPSLLLEEGNGTHCSGCSILSRGSCLASRAVWPVVAMASLLSPAQHLRGFCMLLRGGIQGCQPKHPSQAFLCVRVVKSCCWFRSQLNAECNWKESALMPTSPHFVL